MDGDKILITMYTSGRYYTKCGWLSTHLAKAGFIGLGRTKQAQPDPCWKHCYRMFVEHLWVNNPTNMCHSRGNHGCFQLQICIMLKRRQRGQFHHAISFAIKSNLARHHGSRHQMKIIFLQTLKLTWYSVHVNREVQHFISSLLYINAFIIKCLF